MLMEPMAATGTEAIGSMGNDAPLAVLSDQNPLLFGYFKQLFAQVSNPPLDAIREELVTSLEATVGPERNLLDETPQHCRQLRLKYPVLSDSDLAKIKHANRAGLKAATLSTLFRPADGAGSLEHAMDRLFREASEAISKGHSILILSDRGVDQDNAAIPSLLATAGVHHHLIREGSRTRAGIVVESGEPREVAHFALLIGYGASAVNPYLALESLGRMAAEKSFLTTFDYGEAEKNYLKAAQKGILKIMSKMGISTIQSYCGAQIFEAVGLNDGLIKRYFTWTPSRVGGIGIAEIEAETVRRHAAAYLDPSLNRSRVLPAGGFYQWRRDGEYHMWNPDTIADLQQAARSNDFSSYERFSEHVDNENRRLSTIRGLLEFKASESPIALDEVEPASDIVKRFATGAVSLGSIGKETHEAMAVAMNRIGARSNTGEGGEDYRRYTPDADGSSRNSAMKQVASGRLRRNDKLPLERQRPADQDGPGLQARAKAASFPATRSTSTSGGYAARPPASSSSRLRRTTTSTRLRTWRQLIHDLKNSNPSARVHVKLVAEAGVGTIAAGVSKGHADVVLISGDSGGTGASPESSIKHAGLPWELGLAETQQVLVLNDLRGRIVVQTDGQLKNGRDVAIACLLGAEEFGFATAPLITMGCIMLRKCHLNTCSVGIATQDPELRRKFVGKPEHLINYFFFVAEHLRRVMATLGFRKVDDMVGRVDMLETRKAIAHWKAKGLDFKSLLHKPDVPESVATYCRETQDHGLWKALDNDLIERCRDAVETRKPVRFELPIRNSNRTVGTMLSHQIAVRRGEEGLPDSTIEIEFAGSAGQSFAAFLAKGVTMRVKGDANDYFGKGLSGGRVIIAPPEQASFVAESNIIVGNVVLYGATAGQAFIRGVAGERFAVRNSGAEAVVEGVGDHGCEYMTRGRVVVLGPTGRNFAAGMSGGEAYVFDEFGKFAGLCNTGMVDLEPVVELEDREALFQLIGDHLRYTGSANAARIFTAWNEMLPKFVKVMPRDYKRILRERALAEQEAALQPAD